MRDDRRAEVEKFQTTEAEKNKEIEELKKSSEEYTVRISTLEQEAAKIKSAIEVKEKQLEVARLQGPPQAVSQVPSLAATPTMSTTGTPADTSAVSAAPAEVEAKTADLEKRIAELTTQLATAEEKVQTLTAENAALGDELAKVKKELENAKAETEAAKATAAAATAAAANASSSAGEGSSDGNKAAKYEALKAELEAKHKAELEAALGAKVKELEAQRSEAVKATRAAAEKEAGMRNMLLQRKAEKAEADKAAAQQELERIKGQHLAPSRAQQQQRNMSPQAAAFVPSTSRPNTPTQVSTAATTTTAAATPETAAQQSQVSKTLHIQGAAPAHQQPGGARQLPRPAIHSIAGSAPQPGTAPTSAEQTAVNVPTGPVANVGAQPRVAARQSQLPTLQRPGVQHVRPGGPLNQVMQHLQPGAVRRGPQLMRPGGAGESAAPAAQAQQPQQKVVTNTSATGGSSSDEASAQGTKRVREDEGAGSAPGTPGESGETQKRRREETQ